MSVKARRTPFAMVPLWVYDHPEVTPTFLQVYLGLAALTYDRAVRSNVTEIGERAGLGKSSTYAALGVLAGLGAVIREGRDSWYLPMDEPDPDSATVEKDSATVETSSATVEKDSATVERSFTSRDLAREEEGARAETRADVRAQFEDHFWPAYPPRNGRKIGKDKALERWCGLSLDDRRAALKGARSMAADVAAGKTLPPDAFRWLRDRLWKDWQAPPSGPSPTRRGQQTYAEKIEIIARAGEQAAAAGIISEEEEPQRELA